MKIGIHGWVYDDIMGYKLWYVYILASKKYGILYIGITDDLVRRIGQHKQGLAEGFTKKYKVHSLVYFEVHEVVGEAITRERRLKEWKRDWKIALIEEDNPNWVDMYPSLLK